MRLIDAFSPNEKEKAEMAEIKETGRYKFRCWLPESVMAIGDMWAYFNILSEVEPEWLRRAIDRHIVEDVQTGNRVMSLYK